MSSATSAWFIWIFYRFKFNLKQNLSLFCDSFESNGGKTHKTVSALGTLLGRRLGFALLGGIYYNLFGHICLLICLEKLFIKQNPICFASKYFYFVIFAEPKLSLLCLFWKCCSKTMAKSATLMRRLRQIFNFLGTPKVSEGRLYLVLKLRVCSFSWYIATLGAIGC